MSLNTKELDLLDSTEYGIHYESAEDRTELLHKEFGLAMVTFMVLIIISILAIWIFKSYKIKLFHETGVAMIMGIIFGLVIHLIITRAYKGETYPRIKTCGLKEEVIVHTLAFAAVYIYIRGVTIIKKEWTMSRGL